MRRILIIAPNWIGDAVMSQPLLAQLHKNYPAAQIDVLASKWVAPIYRACHEVHEVLEADLQHRQLQWNLRKKLAKQIEVSQYEACFVLPNSLKSALIPWLANIPFRIAYRGEMRFGLINLALNNPSKINRPPMVEHYLALASALETADQAPHFETVTPELQVPVNANTKVLKKLQDEGIAPEAIYILCPGAEYGPSKRWPTGHFAKLAQDLISKNPATHVILLGSKADHSLAKSIETQAQYNPHIHNWCGETTLDEAIALISLSKALVSNDSGLMHIGAALQVPQVAIFGSSDPHHTPPLSAKAKVIWLQLPCSPCHQRECPLGHLNCLNHILPENVLLSVESLH
ncbi:heptosyltransferase-2 [Polynucleobacter meluiroseus]|uniref:lipopolysaccharide heptosyltransferase II n=1 Tax=Polynucleobacter meluiroseus TaxID=1938814 RepID=A0A240E0C1_9BURK|nr:lipopolysaccharide heptosyltransferase II [Polynucleobacter meluiroseus]SNX27926.1 heptosyltransferase-2 [Polynucleobacter meluiroseus]